MATFAVEKKKISKVWEHPNADKLQLASVLGIDFQFVVGKDQYSIGNDVVYFPIDSVLPQDLITFLGLDGKLSGKEKNRIKTIRLRDQISQGLVCPYEKIVTFVNEYRSSHWDTDGIATEESLKIDLTKTLGVEKYEPPEIPCLNGTLSQLPDGVSVYDIEGVERYPEIVEQLMDTPCVISEKIEGTNWSLTINSENKVFVNQRYSTIFENEGKEHMFWKVARRNGYIDLGNSIKEKYNANQVTLRGELIGPGVQGNYYEVNEHKVVLFDILIDGKYMDAETMFDHIESSILVPVLNEKEGNNYSTLREFLGGRTIDEAATGKSILNDSKLREGIVIKPCKEMRDYSFGRIIIKKRSSTYLEKTGH